MKVEVTKEMVLGYLAECERLIPAQLGVRRSTAQLVQKFVSCHGPDSVTVEVEEES